MNNQSPLQQLMTTVHDYLSSKGIEFATENGQLRTKCLFSGCDEKSKHKGHLYFEKETGMYLCQKCGEKGNLVSLAKFLGDDPREVGIKESKQKIGKVRKSKKQKNTPLDQVASWHEALTDELHSWLASERLLTNEVIDAAQIGWDGEWVVIPVFAESGECLFTKRRRPPKNDKEPKYKNQKGANAALFGAEFLKDADRIVICEGEFDALALRSKGVPAVTSTGGSKTFPEDWIDKFTKVPNVHIILRQ